jgi:tetratricopeptide (TPR) repeat protein
MRIVACLFCFSVNIVLLAQEKPYFPDKLAENPSRRSAEEWCNFAMELYAQDRFAEAIRYFDQAVAVKPDYKMAYFYRASCKEDLGDRSAALTDYLICMHLDPLFVEALFSKALLHYKMQDFQNAEQDLTKLLRLPRRETQTVYYQNVGYGKEKVVGGIFTLQSRHAEIYNYRSLARMKLQDLAGALADIDSAILLNSHNPNYYINRGLIKVRRGEKENAIADYEQALKLSPENALALYNLQIVQGKADTQGLISFEDKFPPFYIKRANEALKSKLFSQAIADYDTAIILGDDSHSTFYNRGYAKEKVGNLQEAIKDYTTAIRLKQDFTNAYIQRGNVYFKQKKFEKALQDYTQVLLWERTNANVFYNRGLAYHYLKNTQAACEDLKKAKNLGMEEAQKVITSICK